jgi:AraC family transcriptional regulator, melibiose operon regulatory protein
MTDYKNDKEPINESLYDSRNTTGWFRIKRYYAMNFDFFEMEPHKHREFEIMYVASGSCKIFCWVNENQKEEWILREGEYVLIDCNTIHQLEVVRGTQCRILNLEISIQPQEEAICLQQLYELSKSYQDFLRLSVPVLKGFDDAGNLHTIITELHKQLQSTTDETEHRVLQNLILAQLLIEIGRKRSKKYRAEGGSKYVRKALSYLSDHFDQDVKIKDMAEEVGISVAYLQRLFKEQTEKTLVDKMNELRIEKAKFYLETSRLPITDIAVSVGFNNRQHFTYTFVKLIGCSPAIYRKHKGDYHVWKGFEEE